MGLFSGIKNYKEQTAVAIVVETLLETYKSRYNKALIPSKNQTQVALMLTKKAWETEPGLFKGEKFGVSPNKYLSALAVIFVNIQFMPDEYKRGLLLLIGLEFGREIIDSIPVFERNRSDGMAIYIAESWIEDFEEDSTQ